MIRRFFILILVVASFLANVAFAQVQNYDIDLSISPLNPTANQNVTATVSSYVIDVKNAYFVWRINDEIKSSGIGKNSFLFTVSSLGSENVVSVNVNTTQGASLTKSLVISGGEIDMLWEAVDSYSPPFYKGKTLFAKESEIKVVAMPSIYSQNRKVSPNTLSYNWTKDSVGQSNASGFGKNFFIYKNNFLADFNEIEVSATDINSRTKVVGKINLVPFSPKILFYKKDLHGMRIEKSLENNFFMKPEGENIVVAPYFFSPKNLNSRDLEMKWYINNDQITNTLSKNELTIKPEEGKTGQANIRIAITNLKTLFQELEKSINVNF
jgi:hypothetical protein